MSSDFHSALAALDWQIELGADECIGEEPVNRFEVKAEKPKPKPVAVAVETPEATPDLAAHARAIAAGCGSLAELQAAVSAFEGCELKRGAKNTVFADGNPSARLMIVGEAPGRDEDAQGLPFVGQAGQLLDKMFGAIGLSRSAEQSDAAFYITNVLPWRPPQNRDPSPEEIAMLQPFLDRHIELVGPKVLVLMGNTACKALLQTAGITRMRGTWHESGKVPIMPMFHPAALLRDPSKKKPSWADLLAVKAKLEAGA